MRASKAQDAKNRAKLTSNQQELLADKKEKKEVGYFMFSDAPESKKAKGKEPAVPPPRKPHETIAEAMSTGPSVDTFVLNSVMENTVEYNDDDVIGGTPPEMAKKRPLLNERKRKVNFFPSLRVIQATDSPVKPVSADIELNGFTPQSSTSRTAPGSGMSTMSYDIDVDIKRELTETDDSGSEYESDISLRPRNVFDYPAESDDLDDPALAVDIQPKLIEPDDSGSEIEADISLRPRNVFDYPAETDDLDNPALAEDIQRMGTEADVALRAIADSDDGDLLFFDWRSDFNHFEGVREIFTGPSGPTFEVMGLTPLEVLKKIWDDDIIDHIVLETNRYAHQMQAASKINSRMSRWKVTTGEEIWTFLTIMMLQSLVVNNVEREYWYPRNEQLRIGAFGKVMSFNRFILLKKCLHFVDNTILPENASKLDKVIPIIKHLNNKFSTIYLPEQNVAIDESLLLWKGRLSFAQLIKTKRAKVGIKSYELCESKTGYLWRMEVYSSKGHVHAPQEAIEVHEPESAISRIVYTLMRPLFGKGHTIVMDNFYNAPLLSRLLKIKYKTDTIGTLRLNREFVPETLKCKNKNNMKEGEVSFSTTKDLSVVVWKDKNVVAMISTFHQPEVCGKEKYGYYRYKPKVVLDYNLLMGGVDHRDQMLSAFPVERVSNICWYKKLFRRLVNVSVHNALVIYNHDRTQQTKLGNRDFRLQLVREMLQMYSPRALNQIESPSPAPLSQLHLPTKNQKSQRCKWCHEAKVRRTTVCRCSTCNVNLCIEGCYTAYHAKYVCK